MSSTRHKHNTIPETWLVLTNVLFTPSTTWGVKRSFPVSCLVFYQQLPNPFPVFLNRSTCSFDERIYSFIVHLLALTVHPYFAMRISIINPFISGTSLWELHNCFKAKMRKGRGSFACDCSHFSHLTLFPVLSRRIAWYCAFHHIWIISWLLNTASPPHITHALATVGSICHTWP